MITCYKTDFPVRQNQSVIFINGAALIVDFFTIIKISYVKMIAAYDMRCVTGLIRVALTELKLYSSGI